MIINSTLIFCLIPELEDALVGLRITDVNVSSDQKELLLQLRGREKETDLYFSAHPKDCRIEMWQEAPKDSREHYQKTNLFSFAVGGHIQKVEQSGFDRVITILCEKRTQFGTGDSFALILELTGRNSNAVLVKKDGTVVDCLRKIDASQNRFRQILPGAKYLPPPTPTKMNPLMTEMEDVRGHAKTAHKSVIEWLRSSFLGMDELLAQKIINEAGFDLSAKTSDLNTEDIGRLWKTFCGVFEQIKSRDLSFQIVTDEDGTPQAISCVDLPSIPPGQRIQCESLNSAIISFFSERLKTERTRKEAQRLSVIVQQALTKAQNREEKIEDDFMQAERFEEYRRFGELLLMHKGEVEKGQISVKITDVFDPERPRVEIPLNHKLNAIANAQLYFKRYKKAKDALSTIHRRRSETIDLITDLQRLSAQLSLEEDEADLEDVRNSLIRLGLLRHPKPQIKNRKPGEFSPRKFVTKSGWEILVGRNNRENDYLTFKLSRPEDLWFHAENVPGSHVLLRGKDRKSEPSPLEIREAAQVAAHYSKAKKEKKAAVIYTQAKHVRKPKGGKLGLALVSKEKSILVEPRLPADQM
ncbi:MAG: NFACT family protein [Candidatus Zixiibacteriota bacterium]